MWPPQFAKRPVLLETKPTLSVRCAGLSAGYGFLEFETHRDAEDVLDGYSEKPIPGTQWKTVLRWGTSTGAS